MIVVAAMVLLLVAATTPGTTEAAWKATDEKAMSKMQGWVLEHCTQPDRTEHLECVVQFQFMYMRITVENLSKEVVALSKEVKKNRREIKDLDRELSRAKRGLP